MNTRVIKRMMHFQITVHHTVSTNSLGDKVGNTFTVMGYLQENTKLVLNRLGRQETSGAQVYLTGVDVIKIDLDDLIDVAVPYNDVREEADKDNPEAEPPETSYRTIFAKKPILKKDVYYKPNATVDVGVLYLP